VWSASILPILGFLSWPFRSRVRSRHATDGQTDRQTPCPSFYNAPRYGGWSITNERRKLQQYTTGNEKFNIRINALTERAKKHGLFLCVRYDVALHYIRLDVIRMICETEQSNKILTDQTDWDTGKSTVILRHRDTLKPGFHYPSWRGRVNGPSWRVTGFHYPSTRAVLTGARFH